MLRACGILRSGDRFACEPGRHIVAVAEIAVLWDGAPVCVECAGAIDAEMLPLLGEPCSSFISAGEGLVGDRERATFCGTCGWEEGDHPCPHPALHVADGYGEPVCDECLRINTAESDGEPECWVSAMHPDYEPGAEECSVHRERYVAGTSLPVPDCDVHGDYVGR
jgi:hypothetical protein